jgi:hypothetical protein
MAAPAAAAPAKAVAPQMSGQQEAQNKGAGVGWVGGLGHFVTSSPNTTRV